jgi:4-hydroxy-tetrahydrodipicolinate synthase
MKGILKGVVGAPVTPFFADGNVDYETFRKQIRFLAESGVAAIAHPMHIGESLSLTEAERKRLAEVLVEAAEGRVPTFVHVSSPGTRLSADLAAHAGKAGSTGIVLLPPYIWQPESRETVNHFVTVAKAHGGKLIAYNNHGHTGVHLTVPMCRELLEKIPGLVGLKDASFHMETFTDFCQLAADADQPLAIYTGIEHLLTSMPVGGQGCFSACSEVAPGLIRELYEACERGDLARARPLQFKVRKLLKVLMQHYPSTIKYAMGLMSRDVGVVRAPLRELTAAEKAAARDELETLGVLETEPHGWQARQLA